MGVLRGMFILPCFLMGDGRLPGSMGYETVMVMMK